MILRPSHNVCKHLEQHLQASWRWADIIVMFAITVYKEWKNTDIPSADVYIHSRYFMVNNCPG